jgi:hypothetical protein
MYRETRDGEAKPGQEEERTRERCINERGQGRQENVEGETH